jgi:hypothetical protein
MVGLGKVDCFVQEGAGRLGILALLWVLLLFVV